MRAQARHSILSSAAQTPTPRWSSGFPIKPLSASDTRQNIQNKKKRRSQDPVLLFPTKTFSLEILPLRPLGGTLKGNLWLMLLTHTYVTLYQGVLCMQASFCQLHNWFECVLISGGIQRSLKVNLLCKRRKRGEIKIFMFSTCHKWKHKSVNELRSKNVGFTSLTVSLTSFD